MAVPVSVWIRSSFLSFDMGDDVLDRIGMPRIAGAYFGTEAIVSVGSLSLLTKKRCGTADGTVDGAKS